MFFRFLTYLLLALKHTFCFYNNDTIGNQPQTLTNMDTDQMLCIILKYRALINKDWLHGNKSRFDCFLQMFPDLASLLRQLSYLKLIITYKFTFLLTQDHFASTITSF